MRVTSLQVLKKFIRKFEMPYFEVLSNSFNDLFENEEIFHGVPP